MRKKAWFNKTKKESNYKKIPWVLLWGIFVLLFFQCNSKEDVPPPTPDKNKAPVVKTIEATDVLVFPKEDFTTEKLPILIKKYLLENHKIIDEAPEGVHVVLVGELPALGEGTKIRFKVVDTQGKESNEAHIRVEPIKTAEAITFAKAVEQLLPPNLEIYSVVDVSKVHAVTDKGDKISPIKITINGQETAAENYTFSQAGEVTLVFTFSKDYTPTELTKTLQINYKEAHYGEEDTRPSYAWLGIEVDEQHTYQTHSAKWPRKGVDKNEQYGYFDAKLAIDALSPEWKAKVEQQLRKDKIGWISAANNQLFKSDKIEDSWNSGRYNDHDEAQLRNFLGENNVALTGGFDLWPQNGAYLINAINWWHPWVDEINQKKLKKVIYSSCSEATVKDTWTDKYWNNGLEQEQPFADKLARGEAEVYIIMSNWNRELVTWEEAHTPEWMGKLVNVLTVWLYANPKSAKGINVVTFDRTGSSDTNSYLSPKLMQLLNSNGGKVYYAPSLMPTLVHDNQSPNHYTVNMWAGDNNNSYGSVRYMADLNLMRALEATLKTSQGGVIPFRTPFKPFSDSKGAGYGQMLEYAKVANALFGFEQLPSVVDLSGKTKFNFSEVLPPTMLTRYNKNLRINTPMGWVGIDDALSVAELKKYDTSKGFTIGTVIKNQGIKSVYHWEPTIMY